MYRHWRYVTEPYSSQAIDTTESDYERHVQELHMIFHLAQVLYVPEDGSGMGVVGEELLHWLNAHDVAPTTEQGQQIAETIPPHDHAEYWDYLFRCVLRGFFSTAATVLQSYMTQTRSATLQSITSDTIQILQTVPRSTVFTTEQAFFAAHRHWHTSVRVFLSGIQRQMDAVESELQDASASPSDERLELEAQFRCLLELLCGVQERILEFSEDWKEALCAWGILVQPAIKRDDVPDVAQTIMETLPVDGTLPSESIMASFFRGDITKVRSLSLTGRESSYVPRMMNGSQLIWATTLTRPNCSRRLMKSHRPPAHRPRLHRFSLRGQKLCCEKRGCGGWPSRTFM